MLACSVEKSWARKDKVEILDIGGVDGLSWQGWDESVEISVRTQSVTQIF